MTSHFNYHSMYRSTKDGSLAMRVVFTTADPQFYVVVKLFGIDHPDKYTVKFWRGWPIEKTAASWTMAVCDKDDALVDIAASAIDKTIDTLVYLMSEGGVLL